MFKRLCSLPFVGWFFRLFQRRPDPWQQFEDELLEPPTRRPYEEELGSADELPTGNASQIIEVPKPVVLTTSPRPAKRPASPATQFMGAVPLQSAASNNKDDES